MHLSFAEYLEADGNFRLALEHARRAVELDVGGREGELASAALSRLSVHLTPTTTPVPKATPTLTLAPTPTLAVTPTPTLIPTATPVPLPEAEVDVGALYFREGPGTEYGTMGALPRGTTVRVIGVDPGGSWAKVSAPLGEGPRREGWLYLSYLKFLDGRPELPVVTGE
jgi:hypothetical protein